MPDKQDICPECGFHHLYVRRPGASGPHTDRAFRCENPECGATFDDPDTRELAHEGRIPGGTLAARLDDADPDEVGP